MKHLLVLVAIVGCKSSSSESPPAPASKPVEAPKAEPQARTPTPAPRAAKPVTPVGGKPDGMEIVRAIAANKLTSSAFEINKKFVFIDLTNGKTKVDAFCPDDQEKRFAKLPQTIMAKYSGRLASAIADDTIKCTVGELSYCTAFAQDEHESQLRFQFDGAYLTGVSEHDTFMIDADSPKLKKAEAARDAAFTSARETSMGDCFKPESSRGGRMTEGRL